MAWARATLSWTGSGPVVAISAGHSVALWALRIVGSGGANGGGINHAGATLTLTDCTVTGNNVTSAGSGIFNNDGIVVLTRSAVTGSDADHCGGGIYKQQTSNASTVKLDASSVTGNTAGDANGGGGIFNEVDGTVNLVTDNTVDDNFSNGVENNCAGSGAYNGSGCA